MLKVNTTGATEAALRDSEERLRHIVEHAQDLIYYCDPGGHFTYVNPTAERVMQYSKDELLGRHFMSLIRDDYKHAAAAVYPKQLIEQSPSTYFEFPAITKSGESVWVGQHVQLVHQDGAVVAVHAIARDITPQKLAEERLRASESKYRSLIERAAFGIYRSTETGRILETNEALVRMLGYDSADELKATNMAALYVNPADRHALIEQHRGQSGGSSELRWKRKDGTPILVRLTARTIEGGFEGHDCYETIAEDITGRKALEDQLRQAQKMEAVGRLARGVAHDFNNVLAAIIGYSELITMRLTPDDITSLDAHEIRKAAERGASLTRRLLTFSRSQRTDARIVDLHSFVRDDENMLQRLVGTGVVLQIDTPGDPPRVLIEPGQLEQILLNLLVNARDATPDGGAIDVTISAVAVGVAERVRYPDITAGMYGRIRVRDTGSGIAPDMQAHVFEPFFTTKDPEKGTGLGLSIVYGIAKDAGGTVTFSTAQNEGTTFDVLLPAI